MKSRFGSIILFLVLFSVISLQAQRNYYPWQVGFQFGTNNYLGDLAYQNISYKGLNERYATLLGRNISPSFSMGLLLEGGYLQANDRTRNWNGELMADNPNTLRSLNFKTRYSQGAIRLTYHFDNGYLLRNRAAFGPYIFAGAGLMYFEPYADLLDAGGKRYYYWEDQTVRDAPPGTPGANEIDQDGNFETFLPDLYTEINEPYDRWIITIPFGAGINWKPNYRINLSLEAGFTKTFTDYLDDVSGEYRTSVSSAMQAYASNPSDIDGQFRGNPNGKNDHFAYVSLGFHINLGSKKSFRPPAIYSPKDLQSSTAENQQNDSSIVIATDTQVHTFTPSDSIRFSGSREGFTDTILHSERMDSQLPKINLPDTDNLRQTGKDTLLASEMVEELQAIIELLKNNYSATKSSNEQVLKDIKQAIHSSNQLLSETNKSVNKLDKKISALENDLERIRVDLKSIEKEVSISKTYEVNTVEVEGPNEIKDTTAYYQALILKINNLEATKTYLQKELEIATVEKSFLQSMVKTSTQLDSVLTILGNPMANEMTYTGDENQELDKIKLSLNEIKSLLINQKTEVKEPVTSQEKSQKSLPGTAIYFATNQKSLTEAHLSLLSKLVVDLTQNPEANVILKGYTDKSGSANYNLLLSYHRVNAVKQYLLDAGIQAGRILISFYGKETLPASAKTNDAEWRKVDVSFTFHR